MAFDAGSITVHITATVDQPEKALAAQAVALGDRAKCAHRPEDAADLAAAAKDLAEASRALQLY